MYERQNIRETPRWGILVFADGYEAQIIGIMQIKIEGIDYLEFTLRPYNPLVKRYNITLDDVDEDKALVRRYPLEYIVPLNPDPINTVYFSFLNFDGLPVPATEYLEGKKQADLINSFKKQIFILKAKIAMLTERVIIAETNQQKFIKGNFEMLGSAAPLIKGLYGKEDEQKQ